MIAQFPRGNARILFINRASYILHQGVLFFRGIPGVMSIASNSRSHRGAHRYHVRTSNYNSTLWNSHLIQTIPSYLPKLSPRARILDLACDTGLSTSMLAAHFQDASSIIGVDMSLDRVEESLTEPFQKINVGGVQVQFYDHDILDLDSLAVVQDGAFNVIACFSPFALMSDPSKALAHWYRYLAPGGVVALHVAHAATSIAGITLKHTAEKLGISIPHDWSGNQSEKSLRDVFKKIEMEVVTIKPVYQDGARKFNGTDEEISNAVFEALMRNSVAAAFHNEEERHPGFVERARETFRAEWVAQASKGLSEEFDSVTVGIARKQASSFALQAPVNLPKVTGGCRCSAVRYEAYRRPTSIVVCHCFTCGRLSGSGNLPFIDVPTNSFRYTESRGLKTLRFSDVADRTFCTECGSPITMTFNGAKGYEDEKGKTNVVLGSVDMDSMGDDVPEVWGHIYVGEKCIWDRLPDDGARRLEKFTSDVE